MNTYHKTLWMGNIESWMTNAFLSSILNEVNIFPQRIILKNPANKRGCAFLEFNKKEEAEKRLKNFNGKIVHNVELKFNWVRTLEERYFSQKIKKFTVSQNFLPLFFLIKLFIGNIDKSISFDEIKKYFYDRYSSIISAKLIVNQETGRSKGFAFIEFTNYKEFQNALNPKNDIIFGKQKLVFNSAKNKYDNNDDIRNNPLINKKNNNEEVISSIGSDSCETMTSTAKISRDSNNSNNMQNSIKIPVICYLGNNKKPNIKKIYQNNNNSQDDLLSLQIKYNLNKIKSEYMKNNFDLNKSPFFNYYCNYNYNTGNNNFFNNINICNVINNNEKRNKNYRINNYYN